MFCWVVVIWAHLDATELRIINCTRNWFLKDLQSKHWTCYYYYTWPVKRKYKGFGGWIQRSALQCEGQLDTHLLYVFSLSFSDVCRVHPRAKPVLTHTNHLLREFIPPVPFSQSKTVPFVNFDVVSKLYNKKMSGNLCDLLRAFLFLPVIFIQGNYFEGF